MCFFEEEFNTCFPASDLNCLRGCEDSDKWNSNWTGNIHFCKFVIET